MRMFVTGGTGFIGSHLVDKLLGDGHEVDCLVRGSVQWLDPSKVRLYGALPNNMRDYAVVYHVAGVLGQRGVPLREYRDAHIDLTRQIINRMNCQQLFVYCSTAWVECPEKPYERTKVVGERLTRESGLYWKIVRPGFTYGPRDFHHLPIFRLMNKLGRFFPIIGSGKNLVCPTYVHDVVKGLVQDTAPQITVAGEPIPMNQFLTAIADALGVSHPRYHMPPIVKGEFFAKERRFKTSLQPTELREGLEVTVKWYRERGLL